MADITLSSAVRNNLLSLQNTASLLSKTQERLATGLKVNSALDDPTAFFTASSLESRSGDLNRLLDSVGNALQTVVAADEGLSSITKLVETAQANVRTALQNPGAVTTNIQTGSTSAVINPAAANTLTGTGGTIQAVVVGTADVDTLALDVSAAATINIDGTSVDLEAADVLGDGNNTLTQAELILGINAGTGTHNVTASDGGGGTVDLTAAQGSDIALTDGTATPLVSLGFTVSTTTSQTADLLAQTNSNAFNQGDVLSFTIGSAQKDITIGTGGNEVNTLTELNAELATLTNGTASADANGNISITSSNNDDVIEVLTSSFGGSGGLSDFGLTAAESTILVNGTSGPVDQGDTLTVTIGSNASKVITFGSGGSEVNTIAELKAELALIAGASATFDDTTGAVSITATDASDDIVIAESNARSTAAVGLSTGTFSSTTVNNTDRTALESSFNLLRTQIDELAADASFNGNNLLDGDSLSVVFNEEGTSTLAITGVTFDSAGLGINSAATDTFQSDTSLNTKLTELGGAVDSLRSQASTFGSNLSVVEIRQDFTKNLINVLETGAANLTLADTNLEGANTLALQTRQQLSSVALSLASQADQQVLRLF